jgi:hypothetical protein
MPLADELPVDGFAAQATLQPAVTFAPFGSPVAAEEIQKRLSPNLYDQLSERSDDTVKSAVSRAEIYVGAILKYLQVQFDLDKPVIREIVLMQTVYELHMALGHEEAGREYRIQAKNTIIAAFGSFPDNDSVTPERPAVAAVAVPPKANGRF